MLQCAGLCRPNLLRLQVHSCVCLLLRAARCGWLLMLWLFAYRDYLVKVEDESRSFARRTLQPTSRNFLKRMGVRAYSGSSIGTVPEDRTAPTEPRAQRWYRNHFRALWTGIPPGIQK